MWEPRPLATLGASTASNRDILPFAFTFLDYIAVNRIMEMNTESEIMWKKMFEA
jgi:hypothetical protein